MVIAKREQYHYSEQRNIKQTNVKARKKKSNRKANLKFRLLCFVVIIMITCLSLLLRYTSIAQARMELSELDQEISNLSKKKDDLQIEVDQIMESQWIESIAKEQLGMDYPNSNQTVYVSVDEEIFIEEATVEKEQGFVILKSFRGFFNEIFGLL